MAIKSLEDFASALTELNKELTNYIDSKPDIDEAAEGLAKLNFAKRELSVIYDSFAHGVGNLMGSSGMIETASGITIEKKTAADRKKWRHPELATRVAEGLSEMSVDMDTGEIVMSAQDMVVKLLDYAAVSYWRVGKLGEIGVNPDSYCEQGDFKTSIIVREAK
jgi:hypothetical protein